MWLGRRDRWPHSEGDRVIEVKIRSHLVHLVWIMLPLMLYLVYHIGNICWKRRVKRQRCGQRCNVRTPDRVPMNLITYCCSLHGGTQCVHVSDCTFFHHHCSHFTLPMQLSTESQSCSIRVTMFLGGRIRSKDSTCRDLYIISQINALYIMATVNSWHMQAKYFFTHMYTHADWRVLLPLVLLCLK